MINGQTTVLDTHVQARYIVCVRIAESARKHGIADQDIQHALRHHVAHATLNIDMFFGPARDGQLLEVGVLGLDTADQVVIHAMVMRAKFLPYL